jgi:O-acetyl-ADP-ribose deacetylase (regulator of RNase III)
MNMDLAKFLDGRVVVKVGDITYEDVDAIVNAANRYLRGGGGVDGAIHMAGGPQIKRECEAIIKNELPHGLPTGEAVITTSGNLKARHVIHTVGPVYGMNDGRDAELLANAYRNSLQLAAEHALQKVAFPSISTGVYEYPKAEAAKVSSQAIREFLDSDDSISQVRLVFFKYPDAELFLASHEL